ncbi:NACHT domain-containing protein [Pseudomonas protegens]|uniref:NACHT domain-containing protein n=1 Tax=Pseudomonas protegens TaxID=380021 RepID=UPI0021C62FB0|nr:NACHT domain-containing protein [Pseudomonas protegens]MCU1765368.1 NACHT domain-containing protein [Pseudomonas protegens]
MDASTGQFVADFMAANLERIYKLGKSAFGKLDETLKLKLKSAYDDYLYRAREKYSKSKSFFIRDQPVDLYEYYVSAAIQCRTAIIEKPMFYNCIKASRRIVITGTGGTGKSVLIKHLFLDCIRDKKYVPILIELRELNRVSVGLEEYIYLTLSDYGFEMSREFMQQAMEEGHFCFFFDGYDELDYVHRNDAISFIRKVASKYLDCPIFLSSRPDDVFNGIDEFSIFKMLPLTMDSAYELVDKLPCDPEVKTKFLFELSHDLFARHSSFLSNPLLLSIMLLTYGNNAEIPSKLSIFYNQAYEALFQRHDANKGGYLRKRLTNLDVQDFSKVFALFSVLSYERRHFKMTRLQCLEYISKSSGSIDVEFKSEDYLTDLLSAVCLLIDDGLDVAYAHRSFQEYFVALFVSKALPKIQEKLIHKYWPKHESDNIIFLLYELDPDLIERVLIVPKLKALFKSIRVEDVVEDKNLLLYLKLGYREFYLEDRKFSFYDQKVPDQVAEHRPMEVVEFAMNIIDNYQGQDDEYYESLSEKLVNKYRKETRFLSVKTADMEVTDSFFKDLCASESLFSLSYLKRLHEVYLRLKSKHERQVDDFYALLNIV